MGKLFVKINGTTGEAKITAEGYPGELCKIKTQPFEEKLGTVTSDEPTVEMYNEETADQTQNQRS